MTTYTLSGATKLTKKEFEKLCHDNDYSVVRFGRKYATVRYRNLCGQPEAKRVIISDFADSLSAD